MREQAGDLVLACRRTAPRATPPPRGAGGSARRRTRVRYAASWISACLKRYSGSGQRRPSRTRSSALQLDQRAAGPRRRRADDGLSSGSPNCRPRTDAAIRASCAAGSSRSIRARITFSTVGGTSIGDLVVEPPAVAPRARARRRRRATAPAPPGRTGCPRPARGSAARCPAAASPPPDERVRAARGRRRPTAPRASSSRDPVRELARRRPPSRRHDGWSRSGRDVSTSSSAEVLGVARAAAPAAAARSRRPSAGPRARRRPGRPRRAGRPASRTTSNVRYCSASGESSASRAWPRARAGRPSSAAEVRLDARRARSPNSRSTSRRSATRTRSSGSSTRTPSQERSRSRNGQYGIDSP